MVYQPFVPSCLFYTLRATGQNIRYSGVNCALRPSESIRHSEVCFDIFYCNSAGLSYVVRYKGVFVITGFVITRCHCTSDCLSGTDDVEAMVKLQQSLDKMMKRDGFNLSGPVIQGSHIAEQEQAESSTLGFNASELLKALGMCWNTFTDCFLFSLPPSTLAVSDPETKRSLFSIASRVFDPMGLITPFTIRAKYCSKSFGREVYSGRTGWMPDIAHQWRSWKSELSRLSCITIPRYFMGNIESSYSIQLHGFGDASPTAYGAAVYIKCLGEAGHASTHLVMSKSRVAPAKTVSLPRLELLAAVVNARLLKFVAGSLTLKVDRVVCWTDSMVTLQWIRG